jgi:putative ABC transport system permease protein
MTTGRMVFKSLRQHALSTSITALSIALAGGLLMSVWVVKDQAQETFTGVDAGFDAVLGARSSKLQLVLNSIFHLEESPGNIPWTDYLDLAKNPNIEAAIPIAVGDNYRGYRLVGVTTNLFHAMEYAPGKQYQVRPPGRVFDPALREAVVGSFAARKLNLKLGDTFHPYHGLTFDESKQHEEIYLVIGIMEPSNTPADRVIWIPLEGLQKMSGHDPRAAQDISAVLVKLKAGSPIVGHRLSMMYNRQGDRLTFAWPIGSILAQLFDKVGWFERVLAWIAYLVAAVATGSVLASIYNSMNERRREIAILRALGARRRTIFCSVVFEAAAIAGVGMAFAFLVYSIIVTGVAAVLQAETGVVLNPFHPHAIMFWAPIGMILVSALAGFIPAIKAYRTDVAAHLAPVS